MNAEKTEWVKLTLNVPKPVLDVIQKACLILVDHPATWAQRLVLLNAPNLALSAEERSTLLTLAQKYGTKSGIGISEGSQQPQPRRGSRRSEAGRN